MGPVCLIRLKGNMAQSPDEKTYVGIAFIKQLKGLGWNHIEGNIDVPYLMTMNSMAHNTPICPISWSTN